MAMYPLGEQFKIDDKKSAGNSKAIIAGQKYRITVISERVVRLEYSNSSTFVDRPTTLIRRRDLGLPDFSVKQDAKLMEVETRYYKLTYVKEQPFQGTALDPLKNLKVALQSREDRDRNKDWFLGFADARNMLGNIVSTDISVPKEAQRGLFSLDGIVSIDDSKSKIVMEDGTLGDPPEDHLDIYVFLYDRDFKQVLFDYFKLTGAPALIPRYALGNWWSRNVVYRDQDVKDLVRNFEKANVPISIMVFDHDWHIRELGDQKNIKAGYTFNNQYITNPKDMIDLLHSKGIRVGLVVNPSAGFYPYEMFYKNAAEALNISDSSIIAFDPLNPKLLDVLFKFFIHPLEQFGVDFFWNDARYENDINRLFATNHYLYMDSSKLATKRPLLLARNGLVAPHRYPVLYGGSSTISWESLKTLPFLYLNAANIGVSWWSHDVGGNHDGIEDGELYVRYVELSTFSPIFRFHGARGHYYKKEPWLWNVETKEMASQYMRLRHRLIPYLYTEAYNYTKSGTPLIQPFYHNHNYMWTYDDDLYKNQYFFGSQLLVCPILDKMDVTMNRTVHRFYLPEGTWYDFVTGKKFPGDKKHTSFFREEDYPVFAHAGSIVPLSDDPDYNVGIPKNLEIQIFPGVSNTYTLYEDDGVSTNYLNGYFLKTSIDYNYLKNNYTVIIRSIDGVSGVVHDQRNYKMVFRNTKLPEDILIYFNANKINKFKAYVDQNDFIIEIEDCPTIGQLTINCKGDDIEIDAQRIINDDVDSILMDLPIKTYLKEKIADIMFSDSPNDKKRIAIRNLKKSKELSSEYQDLFLRLLDYINEV